MRANISLAAAKVAIKAAQEEAASHHWSVSVAVTDASGELVAFERDDQAANVSIQVAIGKARTASLIKAPSKLFEDFINDGFPSFLSTPGVTPLQGGVPVIVDGQVVGAVGVSGAKGDEDNHMAEVAVAALQSNLK